MDRIREPEHSGGLGTTLLAWEALIPLAHWIDDPVVEG